MERNQVCVEVDTLKANDFQQFLDFHQKVDSYQRISNQFHIFLKPLSSQYFSAFIQGIRGAFLVQDIQSVKLCQANCRDGSNCLNHVKKGKYCSKHQ